MIIPDDARTWAEIDLSAIRHNLSVVRKKIGPRPGILAVVKANAYGHGSVKVAGTIAGMVQLFGVASVEEAGELIDLDRDILLLSPSAPGERREVVARHCIATVSTAKEAADFAGGRVNFKVDTGMGRIGCWEESALEELGAILRLNSVEVHSISTHLPVPDEDAAYTLAQLGRFAELAKKFRALAPAAKIHALNSAGILGFPEPRARPGPPWCYALRKRISREIPASPAPRADMESPRIARSQGRAEPQRELWKDIRHCASDAHCVAGCRLRRRLPRQASGRNAHVLIGGIRCPVLGRVTMDQILADVTRVPEVAAGDEAVLIGQQGSEEILARELAEKAGTISWDIFTGIGPRVRRLYTSRNDELIPGKDS